MNKILQNENTAPAGSAFARKMLNASMSTVEVVGENIVRKTYKRNQFPEPERWLKSYNQLRAWDYRYIKVHKVSNDCGYEARQDKGLSNLIYVHHNAMHKYYRLLSYKKFANEN